MKNYYELLGITSDADRETIKRAYRQLARKYHPDAQPDDPHALDYFKQINEAYQTLINTERRAHYDLALREYQQSMAYSAASASSQQSNTTLYKTQSANLKPDNTHKFVRYTFLGLLFTLLLIFAQAILVSIIENDASARRRVPNPSTQKVIITPTFTPSGPATTREQVMPFDPIMLENVTVSCQVDLLALQQSCDEVDAIEFIRIPENGKAVLQINMQNYGQILLQLEYLGIPENWTFNLGGSPKNDGTNDISSIENDAQLSFFGRDLLIYSNAQNEHTQLARIPNLLDEKDAKIILHIAHQQVTWYTETSSERLASRYWLDLASTNTMVYIGLNRTIIQPTTRNGNGLAYITIWLLP